MLRFFRSQGAGQVIVVGIVAAIILVFVIEFRAGRGNPTGGLKELCAVRYQGHCVEQKDYFAAYALIAPPRLENGAARRLDLRRRVLDGLVERELLVGQAHTLGLDVSEAVVDEELVAGRAHVSLPAQDTRRLSATLGLCRLDQGGGGCEPGTPRMVRHLRVRRTPSGPFDYKLYEREIRVVTNRGPREFKAMQERELLAERLRSLVRARVRVSNAEVDFAAQTAVIRSVSITRDWFAKYAVATDDATLARWTFENRAQIDQAWGQEKERWTAGCPLVREIVVPLPPFESDEGDPSQQRIEQAQDRLGQGEKFGGLARELSSAPSAVLGGDIGCLSKAYGDEAEELLAAAKKLEPGAREVVKTKRAYHLIELSGTLPADKVEEQGRAHLGRGLYLRFAADEAARGFADRLIERAKAGQKLEEAVTEQVEEALSVKGDKKADPTLSLALNASDRPHFEVSPPFGRSGNPLPQLRARQPIASLAFELEGPDSTHPSPIETDQGLLVIQLKERTKPEELGENRSQIERALWQLKADEAVERYVDDLRRAAGAQIQVDASFGENPDSNQP